jgi:glycosyltransferase involved in cell wall biosynthesis
MNEPLVSVVTPTFNAARFLEETIESVLAQTYPRLEHIVVDGDSTDGTLDIVKRYPHLRWLSEPDAGQSDALNKGFTLATGEIVAWLNADDFYLPHAAETAVAALSGDEDAAGVYSNLLVVDESGRELIRKPSEPFDLEHALRFGDVVPQPTAFFRKRVFDEVGGLAVRYHYAMDFDLWIRMAKRAPLAYVDDYWAAFRLHRDSKTGSALKKMWSEERAVARAHGGPLFSPMLRRHLRDCYGPRVLARRLVRAVRPS